MSGAWPSPSPMTMAFRIPMRGYELLTYEVNHTTVSAMLKEVPNPHEGL